MLNRREALATLSALAIPAVKLAAEKAPNYLLLDQSEIDAVLAKAKRCDWAGDALKELLARAEAAIAKPIDIPDRGGQWGHWYACKKDGATLVADSPTKHRCPKCNTIYTGEPYDSVYISRLHSANSAAVRDAGLAFRFTGLAGIRQTRHRPAARLCPALLLVSAPRPLQQRLREQRPRHEPGAG